VVMVVMVLVVNTVVVMVVMVLVLLPVCGCRYGRSKHHNCCEARYYHQRQYPASQGICPLCHYFVITPYDAR
jgi:hypothetical protein